MITLLGLRLAACSTDSLVALASTCIALRGALSTAVQAAVRLHRKLETLCYKVNYSRRPLDRAEASRRGLTNAQARQLHGAARVLAQSY